MRSLLLLLFLLSWYLVIALDDPCGRNESTDIHIIGFFPCTASNDNRSIPVDNCDGIDRIPIMRLALEEINERCDLLPGYRLVVDYANSASGPHTDDLDKCCPSSRPVASYPGIFIDQSSLSLDLMSSCNYCLLISSSPQCSSVPPVYHLIQQTDPSQPTKLMILGPACSVANQLMGEIAERILNVTQVSYTASSPLFGSDKISYPRFYRLAAMAVQFADSYVALVTEQNLNWKRVAVIHYTGDLMRNLALRTTHELEAKDVHVILDTSFANDDPEIVVEQIKKLNARIIIAWLPPSPVIITIHFWCMVIKSQLVGPEFVWLLPGWYPPRWWNVSDAGCSANDMRNALEHSFAFNLNDVVTNNLSRIIVSDKNVTQFQTDLQTIENLLGRVKLDTIFGTGYVYDAMWTIALALNSSISILEDRGLGRLEDFTYDSVEMANVFTEAVANVSFEGISGSIIFQQNGDRVNPSIQLRQYRDGVRVPVLTYNSLDGFHTLPGQQLEWQGGLTPPRDSPVPDVTTSSLAETVIAGVVSSIGILSSVFFFVFNLYFNKHPVVKRSSYRLNSLILVAVLVGFVGTLLHVIKLDDDMAEPLTTTICNTRVWINELAFVVAFGTLFAKSWRLYKVFFNKKLVFRKYLSDKYLFVMVAVIVSPILVMMVTQVATFPLTLHKVTTVNENDFSTENIHYECRGTHAFIFLAFAYAEDGILAVFSILVAYETQKHAPKHAKLHKYHESAVINLTTILTVLLSSVCQAIVIIFQLNNNQGGVLLVITLRDCLWMFPMIYLLFIPKIYRVSFRPYTKELKLPHQMSTVSNLIFSARSSFSTFPGRRNSNVSILSALERRSSFQTGRRASDSSIVSDTGVNARSSYSDNPHLTRKEVTFSPIQEHNEDEVTETEVLESCNMNLADTSATNMLFVQFVDEPKAVMSHYKSTEV